MLGSTLSNSPRFGLRASGDAEGVAHTSPGQRPGFIGYPIIWTDVLTPYGTTAVPDSPLAVFGALDFWWFGEHGHPRMDFSSDVYFATDELATRFIQEIDFDYQQLDATAVLLTASS